MKKKNQQKSKKCMHDYKNAVQVGNVDYMCPLCKKLLDPMEWFFMNSFKFIDVGVVKSKSSKLSKKGGGVAKRARQDYELQTGQKVVTGKNYLPQGVKNTLWSKTSKKLRSKK